MKERRSVVSVSKTIPMLLGQLATGNASPRHWEHSALNWKARTFQAAFASYIRKAGDAVMDLVGNSTILDSLAAVQRGGSVCLAGFLGGLAPIPLFNPLLQMPSGMQFSFFGNFMFGSPGFPLTDVPLQDIVDRVASGNYKAKPARVFRFEEIQEAHRVMESNQANGKLVVKV
jgi:NADPH:quinone reductase-like Zn-dependent oxidoreductase